jgi:hypothetical protein
LRQNGRQIISDFQQKPAVFFDFLSAGISYSPRLLEKPGLFAHEKQTINLCH